jgi:hypothetical protein
MQNIKHIISTASSILRSRTSFLVIVGLLVLQASWMALTARYPMAFDENFHFGVIKLYSHQWGPFFSSAPANSAAFGDLVRNPSYLYQYLMSFPYRLIALVVHQESHQIILLRFINVGLFTGGLFAFRRLLLSLRFSAGKTHFSLLMLVLVPVVPFLAGQINYDNLLFLLIPLACLLTLACTRSIKERGILPPISFILLLVVCLASGLVKYAFLPVILALGIYILIIALTSPKRKGMMGRSLRAYASLPRLGAIGLAISLVLFAGLFTERYGVNLVRYKSLQPDCVKLQSLDQCLQYGPWARNYIIAANNHAAGDDVPLDPKKGLFLPTWTEGMMHRLYFAINYDYTNYYELPIPMTVAMIVGLIGLGLLLLFGWTLLRRNPELLLPILVIALYVASLLYVNFTDYLKFKTMLAINGRYLILILPLFFALLTTAYTELFSRITRRHYHTAAIGLATVVLLLTLQGGGILTHIVRSDETWYWPNKTVTQIGLDVKKSITPFIYGANTRTES